MDVHPPKNGINRYWSIAKSQLRLGKKNRLLKPVRNLPLHLHHIAHGLLNPDPPIHRPRVKSYWDWILQPGGTTNYKKQKETAVTQKSQVNFLN